MQIDVTATLSFQAIPPRCRKARYVEHQMSTAVQVPEVSAEQAPIAFVVEDTLRRVEYRYFDKLLYIKHLPWAHQQEDSVAGSKHFPNTLNYTHLLVDPVIADFEQTVAQAKDLGAAQIAKNLSKYLIVDGVVWVRTSEPVYVVATFGLGHDHGGTALMTQAVSHFNRDEDNYYPASEFVLAQMAALEVAEKRGDTESVKRIAAMDPEIEVRIPEAITFSRAVQQSSFFAEGHESGDRLPEYGPLMLEDLPTERLFRELRNDDLAQHPERWLKWDAAVVKVRAGKVSDDLIRAYQASIGESSALVTYLRSGRRD